MDFVDRALSLVYQPRLDVRPVTHLIVVGDVRVPRVQVRLETQPRLARVHFDVTPSTPHTVVAEPGRLVVRFEATALDLELAAAGPPDLVLALRALPNTPAVAIDQGPRYGTFRVVEGADGPTRRTTVEILAAETPATGQPAPTTPVTPGQPGQPATPGAPGPETTPALGPEAPSIHTVVIDPGHGGDVDVEGVRGPGARGPAGTFEKHVTLTVAPPAQERARGAARRARAADARGRPHRLSRRARRLRQQQQGRSVHQPAPERLGEPEAVRRRGLLPQPRRLQPRGPARRPDGRRGAAHGDRRRSHHRDDALGDGAAAAPRAVGGGRRPRRADAAGAGQDEPAGDPAGAVPRARRRQHAGGAGRARLHLEPRRREAARVARLPAAAGRRARRRGRPLPRPARGAPARAAAPAPGTAPAAAPASPPPAPRTP